MAERYCYDAYGTPACLTPAFGIRSGTAFGWEVLYAGYRWDVETGLYQIRQRMYIAQLGSWLQRDALGLAGGVNFYAYAMGNPANNTDPSGAIVFLIPLLYLALATGLVASGVASYVAYRNTQSVGTAVGVGLAVGVLATVTVLSFGAGGGGLGFGARS